ncbi:MAG: hypothetical protein JNJ77_06205 [Planctomycetia bacterium]|nr:hypothetical protein [Planctomycetia bacterium]
MMMRTLLATCILLGTAVSLWAQEGSLTPVEVRSLPSPMIEETYLPSYYFNLDFAVVQPRLTNPSMDGGPAFSSNVDWTLSPRFEFGTLNRGAWNPYIGYRGLYSDSNQQAYEPFTDTLFSFYRSTELHAVDFGVQSEVFPLLSVIRARWDLSARLTVSDFQDFYGFDFVSFDPSYIDVRWRQQFIGAGPRAGLRMELPWADTGLSLSGLVDAGIQWGSYRARATIESVIDGEFDYDEAQRSEGGIVWHTGAQLALRYAPPQYCDRLSFSAGYLYETWFFKDLAVMEGSGSQQFDYHGPFFRMEWKY